MGDVAHDFKKIVMRQAGSTVSIRVYSADKKGVHRPVDIVVHNVYVENIKKKVKFHCFFYSSSL